ESQLLAREIGFTGGSSVFPDSAYSLEYPHVVASSSSRTGRLTVGVAAVPYGNPRLHPRESPLVYNKFIANCVSVTNWLIDQGYSVTLFGSDIGVDSLVNADIMTSLNQQGNGILPSTADVESVRDLLTTISEMDYVVTCRFHGVVLAHLLNKP